MMERGCVHRCRSPRQVGLDGPVPRDICWCREQASRGHADGVDTDDFAGRASAPSRAVDTIAGRPRAPLDSSGEGADARAAEEKNLARRQVATPRDTRTAKPTPPDPPREVTSARRARANTL